jgi:hypothetical protein
MASVAAAWSFVAAVTAVMAVAGAGAMVAASATASVSMEPAATGATAWVGRSARIIDRFARSGSEIRQARRLIGAPDFLLEFSAIPERRVTGHFVDVGYATGFCERANAPAKCTLGRSVTFIRYDRERFAERIGEIVREPSHNLSLFRK